MSRVIKFRGKNNIRKQWYYGSLLESANGTYIDGVDSFNFIDKETVG